jgi:hypothetical protein
MSSKIQLVALVVVAQRTTHGTMHASVARPVVSPTHASALRVRAPRRAVRAARTARASSDDTARSADAESLTHQWMCLNYRPWIKSEEDARKCLAHLEEKENRVFDLERAKEVLDSIKADHVKQYQQRIPFELPKRYPGFLLILERSSAKR